MSHVVFIREKTTKRFLADNHGWVSEIERAKHFLSSADAILLCIKDRIHDAEIVLRAGPPELDIVWEVK